VNGKRRDLVWSSDGGRVKPADDAPTAPVSGPVRVSRETKGRKGKGVTVVTGLPLSDVELAELAGELKRRCGSGGTAKHGVVEIQGDHRDAVVAELRSRGYDAKRSGG
jgi:translation initiation factor 1